MQNISFHQRENHGTCVIAILTNEPAYHVCSVIGGFRFVQVSKHANLLFFNSSFILFFVQTECTDKASILSELSFVKIDWSLNTGWNSTDVS